MIETYEKRKAEYTIFLRLNALFNEGQEIEKISSKYYVERGDEYKKWTSMSGVGDAIDFRNGISNEVVYSIFRLRAIFWEFIEKKLSNRGSEFYDKSQPLDEEYHQIHDFLYSMVMGPCDSLTKRIDYVKNYYDSFCKTLKEDDEYVAISHSIYPKRLEGKIEEIRTLSMHPLVDAIFGLYERCIKMLEHNDFSQFIYIQLFEKASETEKELYKLLYLEFPKTMQDCRGKYYGNFDVINAMRTNQWERFDVLLREKLIACLNALYKEGKTFYTFFKVNDACQIRLKWGLLKAKIEQPFYYRIKEDIKFLENLFGQSPEKIETKIKKAHIESFQMDLSKLLEEYFAEYGKCTPHST